MRSASGVYKVKDESYYTVENTNYGGLRIFIYRSGRCVESMPFDLLTNPEGYKARHGVERYQERLKQIEGLERKD